MMHHIIISLHTNYNMYDETDEDELSFDVKRERVEGGIAVVGL